MAYTYDNIPRDIPERDPPRMYARTYIRTLWELIPDSEPRANALGKNRYSFPQAKAGIVSILLQWYCT